MLAKRSSAPYRGRMFADQPSPSLVQRPLIECGEMCDSGAPGHGVTPIQARLASATPTKWRDALVLSVSAGGWIELSFIGSGRTEIVWTHADLRRSLPAGSPLAVHDVYGVVRAGSAAYSILRECEPAAA